MMYSNHTEDQITYRLLLWLCAGIGPATFAKIYKHFPSYQALKAANKTDFIERGINAKIHHALQTPNWQQVEDTLAWAQASDHHILFWDDDAYPSLLAEIASAPPILLVIGQLALLQQRQIAMVGSRNPTVGGIETARLFAKDLASNGFIITSGLASGIDTASHQGALAANQATIAVMGTGFNHIYPARNRRLAQEVASNGALVSEFPLAQPPAAHQFPRRNRIISGLSIGTLVVEATLKSGSLITAKYALEQNREVFAIPGSIHNPLSRGCHRLIREGAKLTETTKDILEEVNGLENYVEVQKINQLSRSALDNNHQKLVKCIAYDTTPVDVLIERSGFQASQVSIMLLELELNGLVQKVPSGYVRI